MSGNDERHKQILDAAAAVIIRLGYDKATMRRHCGGSGREPKDCLPVFQGQRGTFRSAPVP